MNSSHSEASPSSRGHNITFVPGLVQFVAVTLAYWFAAQLSLKLALVHGQVTPIWPPTGIALVAILVFGRWVWPAVLVASLAVNLPLGPSPVGALFISIGDTLAPLVAAVFLKRAGFRIELDRLRDAAWIMVFGALAAMTVSATIGTSVLVLSGAVPTANFLPTWAVWWTGDAMGVLLVAPFLLSLLPHARSPAPTLRGFAELVGLLIVVGVVTYALFQNHLPLEYLVFPLIMVAAWRFRLRGAAPAALIASGIAIWAAVKSAGPFAGDNLVEKMVTLQVFNVCAALTSFVLAAFVDTRERAAEMRRLYESASVASETKSAFLDMAAHELLTPLTVMSGYLSLLSDGSIGAPAKAWEAPLNILMAKTREMEKTVDDLLNAALLEVGDASKQPDVLDLRDVIRGAVDRAQPRADLLKAEIALSAPARPVLVEAEGEQLGRVLDDLINNALTYTIRTPSLFIGLSADSRRATIRIEDNGVGIPADQVERIFERLYRIADPQVVVPGMGLGLYISRRLAQSYGGTLSVESSTPGEGSVFALSLPLARKAAST